MVRILTTACCDQPFAAAAVNIGGVVRYLTKPWDLPEGPVRRGIERCAHITTQWQRDGRTG
jgi:response regulator RpfG family c-di-GMP phosphodiesterase